MNVNEALAWVADLFEESVENIQPDTHRDSIDAWDSLGVLSLMAELDERFDILLEDEEFQEIRTVNNILEVLRENGKLN